MITKHDGSPRLQRGALTSMILTVCNDFCWQTQAEIVASVEFLNDEVSERSVLVTLSLMTKAGRLVSREARYQCGMQKPNAGAFADRHEWKLPDRGGGAGE